MLDSNELEGLGEETIEEVIEKAIEACDKRGLEIGDAEDVLVDIVEAGFGVYAKSEVVFRGEENVKVEPVLIGLRDFS